MTCHYSRIVRIVIAVGLLLHATLAMADEPSKSPERALAEGVGGISLAVIGAVLTLLLSIGAVAVATIVTALQPALVQRQVLILQTRARACFVRGLLTLLLAFGVVYWVNHPEKRWLGRLMTVAFALVIFLPLVGLLARPRGG